jgi:tetratricopeptide (TPR) repeat protein
MGFDHIDTLATQRILAESCHSSGKYKRAIHLYEDLLKQYKTMRGANHPDTLDAQENLILAYRGNRQLDRVVLLLKEIVDNERSELGSDAILPHRYELVHAYKASGQFNMAVQTLTEMITSRKAKYGISHMSTLKIMQEKAEVFRDSGQVDQALSLYDEILSTLAAIPPDDRKPTKEIDYVKFERSWMIESVNRDSLKLRTTKFGRDHPETMTTMNKLAEAYQNAGKADKALELYKEVAKIHSDKLGDDHEDTLKSLFHLAEAYKNADQLDSSLPLYRKVFEVSAEKLGPDDPETLRYMGYLAVAYWSGKQFDQAIPLFEQQLRKYEKLYGRNHPSTLLAIANLGVNYKDTDQLDKAIPLLEEAYQATNKNLKLAWVKNQLFDGYSKAGKQAEAIQLVKTLLIDARKEHPKDSLDLATVLFESSLPLLKVNAPAEAEPLLR